MSEEQELELVNEPGRKRVHALSFEERLEARYSYQDKNHVDHSNVEAYVTKPEGSYNIVEFYPGNNIVTDSGDVYYSLKAIDGSPATNENFKQSQCQLANPSSQTAQAKTDTYATFNTGSAAIAASLKTISSTYPRRDGATDDPENTGGGTSTGDIITYKYAWTTGDFNATSPTIKNGALFDNASPVSGTKLLTHFGTTPFGKDASSTLKIFVNHTMNGT